MRRKRDRSDRERRSGPSRAHRRDSEDDSEDSRGRRRRRRRRGRRRRHEDDGGEVEGDDRRRRRHGEDDDRRRSGRRSRRRREGGGGGGGAEGGVEVPRVKLNEAAFEAKHKAASAIVAKREEFVRLRPAMCFFIDSQADPNNMTFGSLYSKQIPLYRRERTRKDGGPRGLQSGLAASASSSAFASTRFFGRGSRQLLLSASSSGPRPPRRPSPPPPPPAGGAKVLRPPAEAFIRIADEDDEDDASSREADRRREAAIHHTGELNESIRTKPQDPTRWLALVKYQDEMVKMGLLDESIATEKKVSILARALASMQGQPDVEEEALEDVLRAYLQIVSRRWSAADADRAYVKATQMLPRVGMVWVERLRHSLHSLSLFSIDLARSICAEAIAAIAPYPTARKEMFEMVMAGIRLEFACGFVERAVATLQALLEFHLRAPSVDGPSGQLSQATKRALFAAFWRSGAPRLGERDAHGWGKWAVETRRRLSGYQPNGPSSAVPPPPPPPPGQRPPPPPPPSSSQPPSSASSPAATSGRPGTPVTVPERPDGRAPEGDDDHDDDDDDDDDDDARSLPSNGAADDAEKDWSSSDGTDSDDAEGDWAESSEEEDDDGGVGREATEAYREEQADAKDALERWLRVERERERTEWLPAKRPSELGMAAGGDVPIADALRAAERLVGWSDLAPRVFVPVELATDVPQLVSELLAVVVGCRPWQWGEGALDEDALPELHGWMEPPAVSFAKRLLAVEEVRAEDDDGGEGGWKESVAATDATARSPPRPSPPSSTTEAFDVALGYLLHGVDLDPVRSLVPERRDFALRVLEAVVDKCPAKVAPLLVTFTAVAKGASAAKATAKRLLKRHPNELRIYHALARAFERAGKVDEALRIHFQLLKVSKTSPPAFAICGVVRLCGLVKEPPTEGEEQKERVRFDSRRVATAILHKEDVRAGDDGAPASSRTDVVRVRRQLEAACEDAADEQCFEAFLCRTLFDLFTLGVKAAVQSTRIEQVAASSHLPRRPDTGAKRRRSAFWANACTAYLSYSVLRRRRAASGASTSHLGSESLSALKATLFDGLCQFPDDAWLLGMQGVVATLSSGEDANRLMYKLPTLAQEAVGPYVIGAFVWQRKQQPNRAVGMLDRCVTRLGMRSGWAWRTLVALTPPGDKRRRQFLRGVAKCAWCRAFWVDALDDMRSEISRKEARDIATILEEKGIYLRGDLQRELLSSSSSVPP